MKLYVIEGTDGAGKETQTALLANALREKGYKVKTISFPWYENESSALVKLYLSGVMGKNPEDVNPYAAAMFYACDRFATYKQFWGKDYLDPDLIIIADRYVGSNAIHQGCKIQDRKEWTDFEEWIYDLEFNKLGLPVPHDTIWLDLSPEISQQRMLTRANKITGKEEKDIHEANIEYQNKAYKNGADVASLWGWFRIDCNDKTRDEISAEILTRILEDLEKN